MEKQKKSAILYVDDEEVNLITFAASFRRHYTVFTATSGSKGMEILQKEPIELIITDQRMPEMTGVQFLEAVIPEFPDVIRMILTGFTDVEDIIRAINTGRIYRYITKPWSDQELKLYIDMGLNLYNLQKENKDLIIKLNDELIKKDEIMNLFKKYVPESILHETLSNKNFDSRIIQGEKRIVTILFLDIRNFTRISSKLDAKIVLTLLNEFFTLINTHLKKYNGFLNKFLGDGVLALFGAPRSSINNPLNAVYCGLNILEEMVAFSNSWKEKLNGEEIQIGIGISTGEVVVGNIGSDERIEYSAIGDSVNMASRIEALTKKIPNSMIISESTYISTKDKIEVVELEPQAIKGKEEKIKLFQVIKSKESS